MSCTIRLFHVMLTLYRDVLLTITTVLHAEHQDTAAARDWLLSGGTFNLKTEHHMQVINTGWSLNYVLCLRGGYELSTIDAILCLDWTGIGPTLTASGRFHIYVLFTAIKVKPFPVCSVAIITITHNHHVPPHCLWSHPEAPKPISKFWP